MKRELNLLLKTGVSFAVAAGLWLPVSTARAQESKSVTGEVVDLMCYLDHGAKGEKHAGCGEKFRSSGASVWLRAYA